MGLEGTTLCSQSGMHNLKVPWSIVIKHGYIRRGKKCLKIICLNSSTDGAYFRSRCKLFQARMQDGKKSYNIKQFYIVTWVNYLWFVYWVVGPGSLKGLFIIDN